MRYLCNDPLDAISRVLDTARRLGLGLDRLVLERSVDGQAILSLELTDPYCHAALVFGARLDLLLSLSRETADA